MPYRPLYRSSIKVFTLTWSILGLASSLELDTDVTVHGYRCT